ncbi:hypothetical protein LJC48_05755, partial [Desulfovibrio sp. OttesenSCG-928-C06]|nr:hypothetical protein [Desulfovibrio sp. OttesenSCG-928-C06]
FNHWLNRGICPSCQQQGKSDTTTVPEFLISRFAQRTMLACFNRCMQFGVVWLVFCEIFFNGMQ